MLHKLKADVYSAWDRWRLQNLHLYLIRLSTWLSASEGTFDPFLSSTLERAHLSQ